MAGVVVVAEQLSGGLNEVSLELLTKAREIGTALQQEVTVVLAGHGLDGLATQLQSADRVILVDDPALASFTPDAYEQALAPVLDELAPTLVLAGNTSMGMDLAGGLSNRLKWPLAAYCTDVRSEGAALVGIAQLYGGKLFAEVELGQGPVIVSVIPGSFKAAAPGGAGAIERRAGSGETSRTRFVELISPEASDVDIRKAQALVSVGRGIGGPENLDVVEDLARALGAEVSASRPVVDSGWLPKTRQVGKSGMTVKPRLYFAVGISGAPEHLQGMKDAEFIVAVNTDASAPIFDVAHVGVVADLLDFVPALTERVGAGG